MPNRCRFLAVVATIAMQVGCEGGDEPTGSSGLTSQSSGGCVPIVGRQYCASSSCFGELADLPGGVCAVEPDVPSSSRYVVCLMSPDGVLYHAFVYGASSIQGDGWSHSAYGNGLVPSTLTPSESELCSQTMAISPLALTDAGESYCSEACRD